ncbi:MAG: hypothetical protein ACLPV8_16925 [Steroidobacteraceae bacterium]
MKRLTALIGATAFGIAAVQPANAQSVYYGGFELVLTIDAGPTPIPSGQGVYCLFSVTDRGDASGNNKGYGVGVATMNPAGTSGTCSVLIPYNWTLTNGASNTVTPSFAVVTGPNRGLTAATALGLANLGFTNLPVIVGVPAQGRTVINASTRL